MPEYFRINGYKSPINVRDGPFQYAFDTKLTYFDYLHQDPRKVQNFNTFMSGNRNVRRQYELYFLDSSPASSLTYALELFHRKDEFQDQRHSCSGSC